MRISILTLGLVAFAPAAQAQQASPDKFVHAPARLAYGAVTDSNGNNYDALIARHAAANGVPEALVRRVIRRESRGNARAVSNGNYGLMQIRLGTARGMGYSGSAAGLLDADTNMTYAVKYLAGAYKAAGGNQDRAVSYYASGYYFAAKRKGRDPQGVNAFAAATPADAMIPAGRPEAMP